MPTKTITHYQVEHRIGGRSRIILLYLGGGSDIIDNLPVEEAYYIVDLLRNEKPMGFDPAQHVLRTVSRDPVGEGE